MDDKKVPDVFEKAPIPQAVLKNAVPAMAAMLMGLMEVYRPGSGLVSERHTGN